MRFISLFENVGTITAFHGSRHPNIEKFTLRFTPLNDDGFMGAGLYLHEEKRHAEQYALMASDIHGGKPTVYKLMFKCGNVLHRPDTKGMGRDSGDIKILGKYQVLSENVGTIPKMPEGDCFGNGL